MQSSYVYISPSLKIPLTELEFRTSRSSGPGGQNVNKLETRVELIFDLKHSPSINPHLRNRIIKNLSNILDSSGVIRLISQESRSQWQNKQIVIKRLVSLFKSALIIHKKRIATKPTKSSQELRLHSKRVRSITKRLRRTDLE